MSTSATAGTGLKAVNIVFILVFLTSAALQYNDPDPYLWMPIYLYGAFLCYQAALGKYNPLLYFIGISAYGIYALYLLFNDEGVATWWRDHGAGSLVESMKAEKPWIEAAREFFGLVLLIVVLLVNMYLLRPRKKLGV